MNFLYVKTNGKARIDRNLYKKEDVQYPHWTGDYGRIIPPGYVVFDFDRQPHINIMYHIIMESNLKCRMLKTTKGYHFMFRTSLEKGTDALGSFNWLGLHNDMKINRYKE